MQWRREIAAVVKIHGGEKAPPYGGIMENQLSTRQVCFIMFAYSAAGKLLMMPALLSYYSKNDLLFPALAIYLLQVAAVWAVSFACTKTDKTVFGVIEGMFGKAAAKVAAWLLFAFFIMASLLPMLEQKLFVQAIFYDTIPSLITFLPFFALSVYVAAKGLRNAGRVADVMFPLFCAALAAVVAMSVGESNMGWLLPVLKTPFPSLVTGARFAAYNFSDGAVMLMFMGRFACRRGDCTKITLSYALSAVAVLGFLALFYSIFSSLAPDQYFAISKIAIFFGALSLVGRVDLIAVYAIEACMLFALILYLQLAVTCACHALGKEQTVGRTVRPAAAVVSVTINAVLLALVVLFNDSYLVVQEFYGRYLWAVWLAFSVVLPLLALVLTAVKYKKSSRGSGDVSGGHNVGGGRKRVAGKKVPAGGKDAVGRAGGGA